MTDLIAEIRAFVARDGWERETDAITALEDRIQDRTGQDRLVIIAGASSDGRAFRVEEAPRYLRSRDAAAVLRRSLQDKCSRFIMWTHVDHGVRHPWVQIDAQMDGRWAVEQFRAEEAVAEVLAVLAVGHKLGIWK